MADIGQTESSSSLHYNDRTLLDNCEYRSAVVVRPCRLFLQLLGVWKPVTRHCNLLWEIYLVSVSILWLGSLVGVICLDFVHYGFKSESVHVGEILNSIPTCFNLLCPYVFTVYYFKRAQYDDLITRVQVVSEECTRKLQRVALRYTVVSVVLWCLGATFFICHWVPFFSIWWHYAIYILLVVYTTGWWGIWLSIYGFVCHVHSLEIDILIDTMKETDSRPTTIICKLHEVRKSLERSQKDFNWIISFALVYHAADLIIFSFAYFHSDFGEEYKIWQYVGGVLFDLVSIAIKLYPPAVVAAAVHRIIIQASERCAMKVTPETRSLPVEDMQMLQYMTCCESDMGLKILGIRITVELAAKIFMTIATAAISFVAFVVPRLK